MKQVNKLNYNVLQAHQQRLTWF